MPLRTMPTTFEEVYAVLRDRRHLNVEIGHNTTAWQEDDDVIYISLHGHAIIKLHSDGDVSLRTEGYATTTTFDRFNRFLPAPWRASRAGGNPHVTRPGLSQPFTVLAHFWTRIPCGSVTVR